MKTALILLSEGLLMQRMTQMIRQRMTSIGPFIAGFAHAFDLFGVLSPAAPNPKEDGFKKDMEAIAGDWQVVGDDLRRAMKRHSNAHGFSK